MEQKNIDDRIEKEEDARRSKFSSFFKSGKDLPSKIFKKGRDVSDGDLVSQRRYSPEDNPSVSKTNVVQERNGKSTSQISRDVPSFIPKSTIPEHRVKKFYKILSEPVVDLDALRELSWNGIPSELRGLCWRLLLGYLPPNRARQEETLERRRYEYKTLVPEYYDVPTEERSEDELTALRQVAVDVPRTAPSLPFFHQPIVQKSLERLLYIWGIRHPASGYVQGMNEIVTPFLAIFLSEVFSEPLDNIPHNSLTEEVVIEVEADCYWCLCKLIEAIQDHYTYAQPGIQKAMYNIKNVVRKVNPAVASHLEEQQVDFIQFAFRWVNCLLIREVTFSQAVRLWDTYIAEGAQFNDFFAYVCAAFLLTWADKLLTMDFQDLILFLQKPPTSDWDETQLMTVLSKAYIWRASLDAASPLKEPRYEKT